MQSQDSKTVQTPLSDLTCNLCCKKFVTSFNLHKHEISCRNRGDIRYRCHSCNKGFKRKHRFDIHKCTNCTYCFKFLHSLAALREHINACHMGDRNVKLYACDLCGSKFTFKATLSRHIMSLHYRSEKAFFCSYCPKTFKNALAMKIHARKHKTFVNCEVCGAKVNHRSIHEHRKSAHGIDRFFCCPSCPAAFKLRSRLRYHQKVHNGEDNRTDLNLNSSRNLNFHIDTMPHANKHVCKHCHKQHESNLSLRVHLMLTHDEPKLKAIKCDKCDYSTFIKGHMQDHQIAHRNNWHIMLL